ncbi:MAG: CDP-alcohol phosphatidyltransferase family protein [Deltaproteobacteria bacterium]|nr:CDP-alcohol phosphatidyltransferase family protein [Deltaproteobacteria bacterium]
MSEPAASAQASTRALIVGSSATPIWGLTGEERLKRLFATKGIPSTQDDGGPVAEAAGSVIGIRGDHVIEATLVVNLMATEGMVLCLPDGRPVAFHVPSALAALAVAALRTETMNPELQAAVKVVHPKDLAYNRQLRKRATPYVLPISDQNRAAIEKQVFAGSYKGVTDIATKFLFPWPVRQLTHVAAALRLLPNHVTFVSFVLTVLATWFFYQGQFWAGILSGWGMCLLDSVDGKLARVTLTSSKLGDVFDHGIDLIHPPFWYWSWMAGLGASFSTHPQASLVFGTIMVGYVAQRALEGLFIKAFGLEMHIWRPFDSTFRLVTARRNPNLIILTLATLVGRPLEGILLVALWTAVCFGVHLVQVVQAAMAKAKGQPIESWLTQEAATD